VKGEETGFPSRNSLIQSILAAYIVSIRAVDVPTLIADSSIFELLLVILGANREALRTSHVTLAGDSDRMATIREIQEITVSIERPLV